MTFSPRFTGIFIPVEILSLIPKITITDAVLLSWIDALYDKKYGGCHATNRALADGLDLKSDTVKKAITKFRKLGYVEDIGITPDGRRIIRALVGKIKDDQQRGDRDQNPGGVGTRIPGGRDQNPYRKQKQRKEKTKQAPPCSSAPHVSVPPDPDDPTASEIKELLEHEGVASSFMKKIFKQDISEVILATKYTIFMKEKISVGSFGKYITDSLKHGHHRKHEHFDASKVTFKFPGRSVEARTV